MTIKLDRSICCDLNETISREWLVTNGLGGYAAGTVAGVLTRMQHGLLVAKPPDAITPQLLLAKIDEEVIFDQRSYHLGTNEYRDGTLNPAGFVHLETFRLEDGFPVFTYHLGGINGIMLEKRIWMEYGYNTTYIQYRVLRTASTEDNSSLENNLSGPMRVNSGSLRRMSGRLQEYAATAPRALILTLLPFSGYRPYNTSQQGEKPYKLRVHRSAEPDEDTTSRMELPLPHGVAGCTIYPSTKEQLPGARSMHPYHILAVGHTDSRVTFIPTGVWYWNFLHRHNTIAGRQASDDLYLPGVIRATLWPDEDAVLTVIVSTEELPSLQMNSRKLQVLYQQSVERQSQFFPATLKPQCYFDEDEEVMRTPHLSGPLFSAPSTTVVNRAGYQRLLLQAGDRFLVQHEQPCNTSSRHSLFDRPDKITFPVSNYYAMESSIRDALIALPGLMLATERHDDALKCLRYLLQHFRGGLLPDKLPAPGQEPQEGDYGNVDTTLWFCYALDHYLRTTHHYELLEEFYTRLSKSIQCYIEGTTNGIGVDPADGLLRAALPNKALTWMDATVDGKPVTPRAGKPVEVNALWYHALSLMFEWSHYLRKEADASHYQQWRTQCKHSFQQRFWHAEGGYLYDVVDGPDGDDRTLRPNQLLALSLRYPVFDTKDQQGVFDVVTGHLLTPYGLRTLSPEDSAYLGCLSPASEQYPQALHQGSVWGWLIGPYIEAMLATCRSSTSFDYSAEDSLHRSYLWQRSLHLLESFIDQFDRDILGMSAGLFDGDAPHRAEAGSASALVTAELLRIYEMLAQMPITHSEQVLA